MILIFIMDILDSLQILVLGLKLINKKNFEFVAS